MLDNLGLGVAKAIYSPSRIQRVFDKLPLQAVKAVPDNEKPVAAAVNCEYRIFDTLTEYLKNLDLYFSKAAAKHAAIVVLPEFFQLHAISLVPGFSKHLRQGKKKRLDAYDLLKSLGAEKLDLLNEITLTAVGCFAEVYSMYVIVGAGLTYKSGGLRLRSYIIDRNGKISGHQDKMYISDECNDSELVLSDNLSVMNTYIGAVSILNGGDALEWQCYKNAVEAGAKIIAAPQALRQNHDPLAAMRDVQANVQYYYAFGIKSCLIGGDEIGLKYKGKGIITAPFRMTPNMDGIVTSASSAEKGSVICAELDMHGLETYTDFYTGK